MAPRDDILTDPDLDPAVAELIASARSARPVADPERVDATLALLLGELGTAPAPQDEVTPPHLQPPARRLWPLAAWWWLGGVLVVLAIGVALALLLTDGEDGDEASRSAGRAELLEDAPAIDDEALVPAPEAERDPARPKVGDDPTTDEDESSGEAEADGDSTRGGGATSTRPGGSTTTRPGGGSDRTPGTESEDSGTRPGTGGGTDPKPTRPTPTTPTPTTPTPTTPTPLPTPDPTAPTPTVPEPAEPTPTTPTPDPTPTPTPTPPTPTPPVPGGPVCNPATGQGCPAPQRRPDSDRAVGER